MATQDASQTLAPSSTRYMDLELVQGFRDPESDDESDDGDSGSTVDSDVDTSLGKAPEEDRVVAQPGVTLAHTLPSVQTFGQTIPTIDFSAPPTQCAGCRTAGNFPRVVWRRKFQVAHLCNNCCSRVISAFGKDWQVCKGLYHARAVSDFAVGSDICYTCAKRRPGRVLHVPQTDFVDMDVDWLLPHKPSDKYRVGAWLTCNETPLGTGTIVQPATRSTRIPLPGLAAAHRGSVSMTMAWVDDSNPSVLPPPPTGQKWPIVKAFLGK